jgi:hypothetical protein|tara:strand:+ start:225 stop:449 length:225 start_codon:yes stop_codon:yes gene_type:complete
MNKKQLKEQFNNQPTLKDKRLFALKHVQIPNHIKMLQYEKLSLFSVHCLFYIYIGESYTQKRKYKPTFLPSRNF